MLFKFIIQISAIAKKKKKKKKKKNNRTVRVHLVTNDRKINLARCFATELPPAADIHEKNPWKLNSK